MRTSDIKSAHVEYIRGISNPIALKVGPSTTPQMLVDLVNILNPKNEKGRLTLIHRMGATHVDKTLPSLIQAIEKNRKSVVWVCDPMLQFGVVNPKAIFQRYFI